MSSNALIRQVPAGIVAIFAILAGTIVGQQVVPASRVPDNPAPRALNASPVVAARPPAPSVPRGNTDEEDQMDALIAQALDQKTDLNVVDMPIRDAFDALAQQTGIPIEVEPGTVGLLPYGSSTKVTATIQNHPLRESLTALLQPIGLRFDVENGRVIIRPMSALRRVVQRTTWKELDLLKKLSSTPWSDEFAATLEFQFRESFASAAGVNRETLLRLARSVGKGTASQVLEQATDQYGWTWFPSGDLIVVLPKAKQIERQLQKPISVDYTQTSLQDALLDLTQKARVPLRIDPGSLASVPAYMSESFSLQVLNTPIRQVLELIAGKTGLVYFIEPDGVRIAANALGSSATTRPGAEDSASIVQAIQKSRYTNAVVGQILLPAAKGQPQVSIFIREDDLPQDLNEKRKTFLRELSGESLRAGFEATSRPHE